MNIDWTHIVAAIGAATVGAVGTWLVKVWRAGYSAGKKDEGIRTLRSEFQNAMTDAIAKSEERFEEKVEELVSHFQETFQGLRQKINNVELDTERYFLRKDSFDDFRTEYRDDMRILMEKVDRLSGQRQ